MFKGKVLFLLFILCAGLVFGQSQQLTRVAIINMQRVYSEFFRESQAVRDFEARTANVQAELNRMSIEIQELRSRQADAIAVNNQMEISRLETEINRRTENYRSYAQARTAELDRERQSLTQSGSFLNEVKDELRRLGESEGFTHFLDENTEGLLWFSPTFDFTDRLIQSLRARRR